MKRKKVLKAKSPESIIQKFVDNYLDMRGYCSIRIPDALFRTIYAAQSVPIHIKSIIARSLAGIPDNVVCQKIEGTPFFLGMAIENKSDVGKLGQKQRHWQDRLNTNVVREERELIDLLKQFEKYYEELSGD